MACNELCIMDDRNLRQAHLKGVDLTQNQEPMTLQNLTTLDLLLLIVWKGPHE
jgi:hypothetical protein